MSLGAGGERSSSGAAGAARPHLSLAIPGVTVSWSQAPYLFLATAASLAVHEVRWESTLDRNLAGRLMQRPLGLP